MQNEEHEIHLNVPAYRQTKDYTCMPSCCKMMLDYLNNVKLTIPEPELDEDRIAEIMNTDIDGTSFDDIENINAELTTSNPSVEFHAKIEPHTLNDIRNELRKGLPVCVWIDSGSDKYWHAIVIIGMDDTMKTISYNDPIYGEKTISQADFLPIWEQTSACIVKAEIGRITRPRLETFMESGDTNEQS